MAKDKGSRIVWHELMTNDTEAAGKFYGQVVGWGTEAFQGSTDYTLWVAGKTPAGGLMRIPQGAHFPPCWSVYFGVEDVDATVREVEKRGGKVLKPAEDIPNVGRFAFLTDPQGAMFAIIRGNETNVPPETDPKPLEFSWHELITTDLDAGRKFYFDVFGWEGKGDHDMGEMGMYRMFGRDRFTYGGMFKKPADMPAPPNWTSYALVDSADAAAERATKAGGKILNGPMEVPGGDRIAVIQDPQGAVLAVHSKK